LVIELEKLESRKMEFWSFFGVCEIFCWVSWIFFRIRSCFRIGDYEMVLGLWLVGSLVSFGIMPMVDISVVRQPFLESLENM
jgi:hypothetical protein